MLHLESHTDILNCGSAVTIRGEPRVSIRECVLRVFDIIAHVLQASQHFTQLKNPIICLRMYDVLLL